MPGAVACVVLIVFGLNNCRPVVRFGQHVGKVTPGISHIQVAGFSVLLCGQWLFSCEIAPTNVQDIVTSWSLTKTNSIDLKARLATDTFWEGSEWRQRVPGQDGVVSYVREADRQWIYLVVNETNRIAWLFKGYHD